MGVQQDMAAPEHFPPVTLGIWEIPGIEIYGMMSMVKGFLPRILGTCTTAHQTDPQDADSYHLQEMKITTLHTALPHAKPLMCSS